MGKKKKIQIPTARQLPSGNWFVQLRIDGRSISVTKSTEREAIAAALAIKEGIIKAKQTPRSSLTLYAAIDDYIAQRENVLSPATIAGYRVIQRNRFKSLHKTRLCDIDAAKWQRAVNAEARTPIARRNPDGTYKTLSAKTLKNSAMFVQTIIAEYTGERETARMPQVVPNDLPWLTHEQIPVFLNAIEGNKYEIPALLALSSLRYSEIVSMQWRDIDILNGTITVHGASVKDDKGRTVQKDTNKNLSSRRVVPFLIPQLRKAVIRQAAEPDAFIYPRYSNVLRLNINKICAASGLPQVGVHGLRRSFASLCYHLKVSEAVAMMAGGWSDFRTMRKIYVKISETDIQSQARLFNNFFENANDIANKT